MKKREQFFDDVNDQLEKAKQQAAAGRRDDAVQTSIGAAYKMLRRLRRIEMELARKVDRVL